MTVQSFKMPVGRIVAGNPVVPQEKINYTTKEKVLNKDGTVAVEYRCSIAYPKEVFMKEVLPALVREASTVFPSAGTIHPDNYSQSKFAFKVINGDSPECPKGSQVPYNAREGYPGNYIVKISTSAFAPGVYKFENGAYRKLDRTEIKTGDYVVANIDLSAHTMNDGGLYWNPNGFELVGYGQEIKGSGASNPDAMFGRQTYTLPAGASATPISSAPVEAQMPMPTPVAPATPVQAMPTPAYDFLQNAGVATPQDTPAAPAVAMPQNAPQTVTGTVPFATTFPTR